MQNTASIHPEVLDRCLLELAAGRSGGTVGDILAILRERGIGDPKPVREALDVLRVRKEVEFRPRGPMKSETRVVITARGKERVRRLLATSQLNVRVPDQLQAQLSSQVGRAGDTVSAVAITALQEWARMQKYPGIDFRGTAMGRQPFVTGTGMTAWEVYRVWLDHGGDASRVVKNYPSLPATAIAGAVSYATAHLHEMPVDAFGKRPPFAVEVKV